MNKTTLEDILDKLFSSGHFSAEIDRKILQYLVDNTVSGKNLKELDIARDIFGRDEDFNPSDSSIVRSHIYSIRKKLQTYYLSEGANDKFRLYLPKGHYKVEVTKKSGIRYPNLLKWKSYYWLVITTILFLAASIYFWQKSQALNSLTRSFFYVDEDNPVWKDFLKSDLPTLLVIGDYYVYQRPHKLNDSELFIRDVEINSNADFSKFLEKNPELKAKFIQTPLTYLGMEAPYIVSNLTRVFRGDDNKFKIKLCSDLTWQDIQKNNIIFIGSEKTLRIMRYFLNKLKYKVNLFPHKISYTPNYKDTVDTYTLESYYRYGFHDDYSIVAKFPTTDKNIVMMILSFSSFGKTESLKELTSPQLTDELEKKGLIKDEIPPYFEMLFKVHGVERTGFNTEILHFDEVKSKIVIENISE